MTHMHIRRFVVSVAALLSLIAVSASASTAIWGGTKDYQAYFVDPISGATVPAPGGGAFGATSSPYGGWVLVTTPINLFRIPVLATGTSEYMGTYSTVAMMDLAFDPGSGTLYGLAYPPAPGDLYTIDYNCAYYGCTPTPLGASIPGGVQGITFALGGIYAADLFGGLMVLDPQTLQLSSIGFTGIYGITDLAYDSFTRRLIAVSVGPKCYPFPNPCGPETGMIWSIDPLTAQALLLNGNAPPIYGLAELTPEPGSVVLFTTGAVGLFAAIRKRLVC